MTKSYKKAERNQEKKKLKRAEGNNEDLVERKEWCESQ